MINTSPQFVKPSFANSILVYHLDPSPDRFPPISVLSGALENQLEPGDSLVDSESRRKREADHHFSYLDLDEALNYGE